LYVVMTTVIGKRLKIGEQEMNTEMEKSEKNNVGIEDEYGLEIQKAQIENLKKELEAFDMSIDNTHKDIENFKDQWDNDNVIYECFLAKDALKKLNPEFAYELEQKYWDARQKQLEYKYRADKFMAEQKLKQFELQLTTLTEQRDSAQNKLNELVK
jgi:exonuclease I